MKMKQSLSSAMRICVKVMQESGRSLPTLRHNGGSSKRKRDRSRLSGTMKVVVEAQQEGKPLWIVDENPIAGVTQHSALLKGTYDYAT